MLDASCYICLNCVTSYKLDPSATPKGSGSSSGSSFRTMTDLALLHLFVQRPKSTSNCPPIFTSLFYKQPAGGARVTGLGSTGAGVAMETHTHQPEVGEDLQIPTITNSRYSNRLNKLFSPRPTLLKAQGHVTHQSRRVLELIVVRFSWGFLLSLKLAATNVTSGLMDLSFLPTRSVPAGHWCVDGCPEGSSLDPLPSTAHRSTEEDSFRTSDQSRQELKTPPRRSSFHSANHHSGPKDDKP